MNMSDDRVTPPNVQELLADLITLTPEQREREIERLGLSPADRERLMSLMRQAPTVRAIPNEPHPLAKQLLGDQQPLPSQIGAYRIIGILGQGAMGIVYRAEQANPRREVALKVVGISFLSDELRRRFERRFEFEAQTLGRLNHPGIAQVYEAGVHPTEHGPKPFFAMELVTGMTLDEYVQTHNLKLREKLDLIIKLCDAVQYAHQQGVIHRDLKPGNILVTPDGQPKILDFGVARATDSDAKATMVQMDAGQLVGTLPYMSPEQTDGNPEEIDTRSDVYALGVIAYELLGGRLPHDLRGLTTVEATRRIREDEPSRLSSLDRAYRGDVETIVQMALEKDKTRRYETANALAADVKRYLHYEPISARPLNTLYYVGKFAARHKALVATLALTLVVLLAGVTGTSIGLVRAERNRKLAEQSGAEAREQADVASSVNKFLHDMLRAGNPDLSMGKPVLVTELLAMAEPNIGARFKQRPRVEIQLRRTIADTYGSLGKHAEGLAHAQSAFDSAQHHFGMDAEQTLECQSDLGVYLADNGRFDEACEQLRDVLERSARLQELDPKLTIHASTNLGIVLWRQGDYAESEQMLRTALRHAEHEYGPDAAEFADVLYGLGSCLHDAGRFSDSEAILRRALGIREKQLGRQHTDTMETLTSLAMVLQSLANWNEAESIYRRVLEFRRRVLGAAHPATYMAMHNLGSAIFQLGRVDEARALMTDALMGCRSTLGDDHPEAIRIQVNLATIDLKLGEHENAESQLRKAMDMAARHYGPSAPETLRIAHNLAGCLVARHHYVEAVPLLRELLQQCESTLKGDHPNTQKVVNLLAGALHMSGHLDEAETLFRRSLQTRRQQLGDIHPDTLNAIGNLVALLMDMTRYAEAEALVDEGLRGAGQGRIPVTQDIVFRLRMRQANLRKLQDDTAGTITLLVQLQSELQAAGAPSEMMKIVLTQLVRFCEATNRAEDTRRWKEQLQRLHEGRPATLDSPAPTTSTAPE
jgi:serine/threonine protein kinase/tetratricopeptide (TPR) repeat protein